MAAKSKASMQQLEEEKKKLSEDLISFIRKRSDTDAPMYTAKLRTVVNLQRKRRKASVAAARHGPPRCHAHRFHYAKKKFSTDELVETHADQAESVDNRSRSRSRSASIALTNDLDEACARKKKKRKCKKKIRSCSCKKKRKRSCHKKPKKRSRSIKKKKRCAPKKKACRPKRRRC